MRKEAGVNRNESTLLNTVRRINDNLESDDRSRWLADVLAIWDREQASWMPQAPHLLRTEMRDITLSWDGAGRLSISTDPVNTYAPDGVFPDLLNGHDIGASCAPACNPCASRFAWRTHPGCKGFIGEPIERIAYCPSEAGDALWVRFRNGQQLRLSSAGLIAYMEVHTVKRSA